MCDVRVLIHAHMCRCSLAQVFACHRHSLGGMMSHNWSHGTGGSPGGSGSGQGSWQGVGGSKGKGSGGRRAHSPLVAASAASHFGKCSPQVAQRHTPQVAESAASASVDLQVNLANMKDLTQQGCGEAAKSCRIFQFGESIKDYRVKMLTAFSDHQIMKLFFMVWLKAYRGEDLCMEEDLCWTEDNMEDFFTEDEEEDEEEEEEEQEESLPPPSSSTSTEHWSVCGARLEPTVEYVCVD